MEQTERRVRSELLEEGRVLRIVLAAGKGNVIDRRAIADLREGLADAGSAPALRAVLLDHEGPHFSFGASVEEHAPGEVETMLPAFHALARELLALDLPILAAVRGLCLGGGLELAALAERIFAAPGARFGQPEITLGVFAPIGSLLLPRLVGAAHAAELLLTGRTIEAEEAQRMGLVAELAPDPAAAALTWARTHLVDKSASSLRFATRAARAHWIGAFDVALGSLESAYLSELMATRDAREGIAAFLEKRDPVWADPS